MQRWHLVVTREPCYRRPAAVAGPGQLGQAVRSMRAEKMDEQNSPAIRRTRTWQMRHQTASRKRDRGDTLIEYLVPLFIFAVLVAVIIPACRVPSVFPLCRNIASGTLAIPASCIFVFVLFKPLQKVSMKYGDVVKPLLCCSSLVAGWFAFAFAFWIAFVETKAVQYALAVLVVASLLVIAISSITALIHRLKSLK